MIIWFSLKHYPYLSHTGVWRVEVQLHMLLISALAGCKRSASYISQCASGGRNFMYTLNSTAGRNVVGNRKFCCLCLIKCINN